MYWLYYIIMCYFKHCFCIKTICQVFTPFLSSCFRISVFRRMSPLSPYLQYLFMSYFLPSLLKNTYRLAYSLISWSCQSCKNIIFYFLTSKSLSWNYLCVSLQNNKPLTDTTEHVFSCVIRCVESYCFTDCPITHCPLLLW